MQVVAKRRPDDEDILDWLSSIDGFLEGLTAHDGSPTRLYDYQRAIATDDHPFIVASKSRQIGWSFVRAARAIAKSHLRDNWPTIFVSLNLEEAKEKIRYADMLWESMPASTRLRKKVDRKLELEFSNGSRIMCLFKPRGKGPADVDIDEHAHFGGERDRGAYLDALPIISRGGQIATGSTPLGQSGQFWEIVNRHEGKYTNFHSYSIHWWDCPDLCRSVRRARKEASQFGVQERVGRFGTVRLKEIFESMAVEDFLQEYELEFIGEDVAYFPYELILPCTEPPPDTYETYAELAAAARGTLYAGYDVGRRKDCSELTVVEKLGDRLYERLFKTFRNVPFEAQKADLNDCLATLPGLVRLCIDETGIGMNLAEDLTAKQGSRVEPVTFTNEVKDRMAVTMKIALERKNVNLYPDRDRLRQIHSVKRIVTPGGAIRFDASRNEKHHADKFWSQALAVLASGMGIDDEPLITLIGGKK
ncbi:MAG: hypothetical protein A2W26_04240 [Acidobacteria bacterium RBG_16_64_8]|nr:MAG: hypothetical protein A2W26_04240 [Acidobacteria bacterium RBG_16_64_8]